MISNQADSVRCSPTQNLWAGSISPQFSMMFLLRVVLRISFPPKFLQTFRASTQVFCSSKYISSFIPGGKNANSLWYMAVVKDKLVLHTFLLIQKFQVAVEILNNKVFKLYYFDLSVFCFCDRDFIYILLSPFFNLPKCMVVM